MKRMVSLLMAVVLLLTLTACGASNEEGATDSTTTHVDGGELTSTTTTTGESADATTTEGETTTTESATTTSTGNGADNDGSATTATANKTTTTKKTVVTAGNSEHEHTFVVYETSSKCLSPWTEKARCACGAVQTSTHYVPSHAWSDWSEYGDGRQIRTCSDCKKVEYKGTATQSGGVVCKSFKLIRVERADKTSKVDGEHILDYLLGKNEYFQQGDTLVYEFDFEKGSLADCIIEKQKNAQIEISGNMLKITIVKNWAIMQDAYLDVWLKDKAENRFAVIRYFSDKIFWYDCELMDKTDAMSRMFAIYAEEKYGIYYLQGQEGEDRLHYTKTRPSITGGGSAGLGCDDLFYKADVENWVKHIQWILGEYKKIGIVSWSCVVKAKHVVLSARTKDCCDNHAELS